MPRRRPGGAGGGPDPPGLRGRHPADRPPRRRRGHRRRGDAGGRGGYGADGGRRAPQPEADPARGSGPGRGAPERCPTGDRGHGGRSAIGQGIDVHRFCDDPDRPLVLGGVVITGEGARPLEGHSDADAVAHAIADAVLGAAGLGDLGRHAPDTDPAWAGADSMELLARVVDLARAAGWTVVNADCTVVAERPRLAPFVDAMSERLAAVLGGSGQRQGHPGRGTGGAGAGRGDRLYRRGAAGRPPRRGRSVLMAPGRRAGVGGGTVRPEAGAVPVGGSGRAAGGRSSGQSRGGSGAAPRTAGAGRNPRPSAGRGAARPSHRAPGGDGRRSSGAAGPGRRSGGGPPGRPGAAQRQPPPGRSLLMAEGMDAAHPRRDRGPGRRPAGPGGPRVPAAHRLRGPDRCRPGGGGPGPPGRGDAARVAVRAEPPGAGPVPAGARRRSPTRTTWGPCSGAPSVPG